MWGSGAPRRGGVKRPADDKGDTMDTRIKKLRQRVASIPFSQLNPVQILNEYQVGLEYDFDTVFGQGATPSFHVRVKVDDKVFEGTASSKQRAKLEAATKAIRAVFADILSPPDVVPSVSGTGTESNADAKQMDTSETMLEDSGTNPTLIVSRLRPGTAFETVPTNLDEFPASFFKCSCVVDGQRFEAEGNSKRLAKARAAEAVLKTIFGLECSPSAAGFPVFKGGEAALASALKRPSTGAAGVVTTSYNPPELLAILPEGKNPMTVVNELYLGTEFVFEDDSGPGNYGVRICVEEQFFQGRGPSKKLAKMAAAIEAINYLWQKGILHQRYSERDMQRRPKVWPRPTPQFAQDEVKTASTGGFNQRGGSGGFRGSRGGNRGGYRGGRGSFSRGDGSTSWVSGGVLNAGDFMGMQSNSNYDSYQYPDASYGDGSGFSSYSNFEVGDVTGADFSYQMKPQPAVANNRGRGAGPGSVNRGGGQNFGSFSTGIMNTNRGSPGRGTGSVRGGGGRGGTGTKPGVGGSKAPTASSLPPFLRAITGVGGGSTANSGGPTKSSAAAPKPLFPSTQSKTVTGQHAASQPAQYGSAQSNTFSSYGPPATTTPAVSSAQYSSGYDQYGTATQHYGAAQYGGQTAQYNSGNLMKAQTQAAGQYGANLASYATAGNSSAASSGYGLAYGMQDTSQSYSKAATTASTPAMTSMYSTDVTGGVYQDQTYSYEYGAADYGQSLYGGGSAGDYSQTAYSQQAPATAPRPPPGLGSKPQQSYGNGAAGYYTADYKPF